MLKQYTHIKDVFINFKENNKDLYTNLYYFFIIIIFHIHFAFLSYSPIYEAIDSFILYLSYFTTYYFYLYNLLKFFFYDYKGSMPTEIEYMLYSFFFAYVLTAIMFYRNEVGFDFIKFDNPLYIEGWSRYVYITYQLHPEKEAFLNSYYIHRAGFYHNFFNDMTVYSRGYFSIVNYTSIDPYKTGHFYKFAEESGAFPIVRTRMYIHSFAYFVFAIFFLALVCETAELFDDYLDDLFVDYLKNNYFIFDIFLIASSWLLFFLYHVIYDTFLYGTLLHRLVLSEEFMCLLSMLP